MVDMAGFNAVVPSHDNDRSVAVVSGHSRNFYGP